MSRIRTIKPKFFKNEDLAMLPYEWRLLFIGLWTQADREGRLEDRPKRLKAELFPYDDLDVDAGLGRLANAGFLTRYDVNGIRYIVVTRWLKHQRPQAKEPPSEIPSPDQIEHRSSTDPARQEGKEERREGKEEGKGMESTALRARFERFWLAYPRKVAKDAAWAVFQRKRPDDALTDVMILAIDEAKQTPQWRKDAGAFIPHPRTWLNQGRWQDSPAIEIESAGPLDGLKEFVRG